MKRTVLVLAVLATAWAATPTTLVASAAGGENDVVTFDGTMTLSSPITVSGGAGTVAMDSRVCAVASSEVEAGLCNLTLNGGYTSSACGALTVIVGGGLLREPDGTIDDFAYVVTAVAGVGLVSINNNGGQTVGVVTLVPSGTGLSDCVISYEVAGVLTLD